MKYISVCLRVLLGMHSLLPYFGQTIPYRTISSAESYREPNHTVPYSMAEPFGMVRPNGSAKPYCEVSVGRFGQTLLSSLGLTIHDCSNQTQWEGRFMSVQIKQTELIF